MCGDQAGQADRAANTLTFDLWRRTARITIASGDNPTGAALMPAKEPFASRPPSARNRALIPMLALAPLLLSAPAEAQRPDLRAMSCAQAQALAASRGAVVMTTGQFTFERFVANQSYCTREETVRRAQVTAADGGCVIAYRCVPRNRRFSAN